MKIVNQSNFIGLYLERASESFLHNRNSQVATEHASKGLT